MNKTLKLKALWVLLLAATGPAGAQTSPVPPGSWLMYTGQLKLSPVWSIHHELQYRSYEILPSTEQLLLRAGVNYHLGKDALFTAGYARIVNYAFDSEALPGPVASENRVWQQFQVRSTLGRVVLEHRYRLEQRWIDARKDAYLDRFRYLLRVSVPLNRPYIEKNAFFLTAYNEVFLQLTATPFDRNRLYAALGYQAAPLLGLQAGYLFQTVGVTTRPYLQLGVFYTIDASRKQGANK